MRWFKYIAISFGIVLLYGGLKGSTLLGDPTSTLGNYGPAAISVLVGAGAMRLLLHA